jgi:hypothetical protein
MVRRIAARKCPNFRLTGLRIKAIWSRGRMSEDKYLKGSCKECGNHIEFPPSAAGTVVACPHCGQRTELNAEQPRDEAPPKGKAPLLLAVVACVALAGAAASFLFLWPRSHEIAVVPPPAPAKVVAPPTNSPPTNAAPAKPTAPEKKEKSLDDLKPSAVQLEKAKIGSLVYAVGTISNASEFQRFGVKVELDLFNKAGKKLGTATDYKDIIEPHHEWQFHGMVLDSKTTSAKVSSVKED